MFLYTCMYLRLRLSSLWFINVYEYAFAAVRVSFFFFFFFNVVATGYLHWLHQMHLKVKHVFFFLIDYLFMCLHTDITDNV